MQVNTLANVQVNIGKTIIINCNRVGKKEKETGNASKLVAMHQLLM